MILACLHSRTLVYSQIHDHQFDLQTQQMLTCALPNFDSEDLVSFRTPAKSWTLFPVCVIAALLLLCSLVFKLQTLTSKFSWPQSRMILKQTVYTWSIGFWTCSCSPTETFRSLCSWQWMGQSLVGGCQNWSWTNNTDNLLSCNWYLWEHTYYVSWSDYVLL